MKLTKIEFANLCRAFGAQLAVPTGIVPAQLLWAIGGKESSFGLNIVPRHEPGYCYGSPAYKKDDRLRTQSAEWGCAAHSSYGPWQIMFYNARLANSKVDVLQLLTDAAICAQVTVARLNKIIVTQGLTTVREIADAWNSGSGRDQIIPAEYIKAVESNYLEPMP